METMIVIKIQQKCCKSKTAIKVNMKWRQATELDKISAQKEGSKVDKALQRAK